MRMTKKVKNGVYKLAEWVNIEDKDKLIEALINRMGVFDDYEEKYVSDFSKEQTKLDKVIEHSQRQGRAILQYELRQLLGLEDE